MNLWQSVFIQSRANNGYYDEKRLPECRWEWPKGTWFQARLDYVREREPAWSRIPSKKLRQCYDLSTM